MAAKSDYLENKLIDWFFRGQAFTPPTTIYVGLLTVNTDDDASPLSEVSGGSYARVAVGSSLANWAGTQSAGSTTASSGTSGTTSNNNVITFPSPTANWGTVVGLFLADAISGGNMLAYGALSASKTINSGDLAPVIQAGALVFQEDN